jgi:hypothetical protein
MSSRYTFGRLIGLGIVAAALWSGTATAAGTTPQGLKADGLRLQGIAHVYGSIKGTTPEGLMADGLRLQGIAQVYKPMQGRPAASFYTPQALKAEGLRWQAVAKAYGGQQPTFASSSSSGFDWTDAGIGAAAGLSVAAMGIALALVTRRVRRAKLAL